MAAVSAKHASPEWKRTVRIVRAQVSQAWRRGDEVTCWRCGRPIEEGMTYDVGHIDPHGGEGIDNAAPEHRKKSAYCIGNRAHGGRMGAAITNARRTGSSTFRPLAWA